MNYYHTSKCPGVPSALSKSVYYPRLDGLRAFAVACVLVHHFGGSLAEFFDQGYYGVDLFFVISGFLITSILVSSTGTFRVAYKRFLGRRALRIFPLYYGTVIVLCLMNVSMARENILFLATYTWNYAPNNKGTVFYLWSLSVEEQFYLFWPLVVLLFRSRLNCLMTATCIIIAVGYGQLLFNSFPSISIYNYTGLINRMGSLGMGAMAAILLIARRIPVVLLSSFCVEVVTFVGLVWSQVSVSEWRFPVMGLCSSLLVLKAVQGEFRIPGVESVLCNSKLQQLGRVSYGVYLFHVPVRLFLDEYVFTPVWLFVPFENFGLLGKIRWHSWIVKLPLYSGIAWLLATASYRWLERPLLAYKDIWFPSRGIDE
jgi:peptidoglycan/LPS O-acetylase OafA/YrhL